MNPERRNVLRTSSNQIATVERTSRNVSEIFEVSSSSANGDFDLTVDVHNSKVEGVKLDGPWSSVPTKIANSAEDIDALISALEAARALFKS